MPLNLAANMHIYVCGCVYYCVRPCLYRRSCGIWMWETRLFSRNAQFTQRHFITKKKKKKIYESWLYIFKYKTHISNSKAQVDLQMIILFINIRVLDPATLYYICRCGCVPWHLYFSLTLSLFLPYLT